MLPSSAVVLAVHHGQRRQLRLVVHVFVQVGGGHGGGGARWDEDRHHFVVLRRVAVARGHDGVVVQHEVAQIVLLDASESSGTSESIEFESLDGIKIFFRPLLATIVSGA